MYSDIANRSNRKRSLGSECAEIGFVTDIMVSDISELRYLFVSTTKSLEDENVVTLFFHTSLNLDTLRLMIRKRNV